MSFHKPPPGDTVARLQPRVIKAGIMKKLSSAGWISENGVCYIFSFIDFYIVFVILSLPLVFVHWPAFNKKKKKNVSTKELSFPTYLSDIQYKKKY